MGYSITPNLTTHHPHGQQLHCLLPRMATRDRSKRGPSRRAWCGTENNPPEDSLFLRLEEKPELPAGVRYIAFQLEKGEEGTPHYQIYVELVRDRTISWIKKNISKTAHWEVRRGTAVEASLYCSKDESRVRGPWIIGKISKGAGSRSDIIDFKDAISSGKRKRELWETHTVQMCKYRHMYDDYRRCSMPKRTHELTVSLLVGDTGTGKTRTVHDTWKDDGYWSMPISNGTMWFDGYDQDHRVLIDDFNGRMSKVRLDTLLRILDRYPVQIPVKGSFVWWLPREIAITSNYHPRKWYEWKDREESYSALCRRIHLVSEFKDGKRLDIIEDEEMKVYWDRRNDPVYCNHVQCQLYDTCQNKSY